MNSSGFDPSLSHDADSRKWFVNMCWNHRGRGTGANLAHDSFDGIELQEWHPERGLTGPVHDIYAGTDLGLTEAPHLFRRGDWCFLTTAEAGTALRVIGRESLGSWFEPSLVARRQDAPAYLAGAVFDANLHTWQQAAGIIAYSNRHKFHAALITRQGGQRVATRSRALASGRARR